MYALPTAPYFYSPIVGGGRDHALVDRINRDGVDDASVSEYIKYASVLTRPHVALAVLRTAKNSNIVKEEILANTKQMCLWHFPLAAKLS